MKMVAGELENACVRQAFFGEGGGDPGDVPQFLVFSISLCQIGLNPLPLQFAAEQIR